MPGRAVLDYSSEVPIDERTQESAAEEWLQQPFDSVAFLNNVLPAFPLQPALAPGQPSEKHLSLHDVSTRTQSVLARVTAQNLRFASSLSQLTDEILRSGSRLAYEVEVLRGNANTLHESLTESLWEDIQYFTLGDTVVDGADGVDSGATKREQATRSAEDDDPEFIKQLRMLEQVKVRLEDVIGVFGEAMNWPLAPSELSITSSLISVSGPDPGAEGHDREEQGKAFTKRVKAEITGLLGQKDGGRRLEAATAKVQALRLLSGVWKSTVEERARTKFVDSLVKLVEDKRKQVELRSQPQPRRGSDIAAQRPNSNPDRAGGGLPRERWGDDSGSGAGGIFKNLQRLRDEIYLD